MPLKICDEAEVPETHMVEGIETDLVLYATAEENPQSGIIAWANSCFMNPHDFDRPIAGQVNFNLALMQKESQFFQKMVQIIVHEFTHVLGFSSSLFEEFVDHQGNKLGLNNVIMKKVVRGHPRLLLKTPEILRVAREHFSCQTIEGIELEVEEEAENVGQHFERMILYNEAMTPSVLNDLSYSKFTLALLKDSGWYDVDYNLADPFYFGANAGCSFINQACESQKHFREFCPQSQNDQSLCDAGYNGKALCLNDYYTRYEKCKQRTQYLNGNCKIPSNAQIPDSGIGEQYGSTSKCVLNSLYKDIPQNQMYAGCFEANCEGGLVTIFINGQTIYCQDQEQIEIPQQTGLKGKIQCPDPMYFCQDYYSQCPNHCGGNGYCLNGVCECKLGYVGFDCSEKSGCYNNCNGNGECMPDGLCRCKSDWTGNDCTQKKPSFTKKIKKIFGKKSKNQEQLTISKDSFECNKKCLHHGQCESHTCICDAGWTGTNCSEKKCLNDCSNHGKCKNGICKCNSGYSGEDCSTSLKNSISETKGITKDCPKNCHGHGKCVKNYCKCDKGWTDFDCGVQIKSEICIHNCSGNGLCSKIDGKCTCNKGFTGQLCEKQQNK